MSENPTMFARQLKKMAREPIDAGRRRRSRKREFEQGGAEQANASDARVAMRNSTSNVLHIASGESFGLIRGSKFL